MVLSDVSGPVRKSFNDELIDEILRDPRIRCPVLDLRITGPMGFRTASSMREGTYYRIRQYGGSVVMYGIKPRTPLYGIETDEQRCFKLTPIT